MYKYLVTFFEMLRYYSCYDTSIINRIDVVELACHASRLITEKCDEFELILLLHFTNSIELIISI